MKKIALLLTISTLILTTQSCALFGLIQEIDPVPYQLLTKKPSFNEGDFNSFTSWVNDNIQYPEDAKANGIEGRVVVQFIIDAKGQVKNVTVLRGVSKSIDQEAIRVISQSPLWTPAEQNGRRVPTSMIHPVNFYIR